MDEKNNLTTGSVSKTLVLFALPYLLSCFLQTLYGMADLFVVGLYNTSETTTAVSVGSQVTHMLTVVIVGLAMGSTVKLARAVGARDEREARKTVGTTIIFFAVFALVLTGVMYGLTNQITHIMMTPKKAVAKTNDYLSICFLGIPFITAYNVISSIFRGAGDSKRPMFFVAVASVVNIICDFVFVGYFKMGAAGAAYATVIGQGVSVAASLYVLKKKSLGFMFTRKDIRLDRRIMSDIFKVGFPISLQDGFIQIAFLIITVIANSRGLTASAAVGIVEKIICFMFLVPSAFLSSISAITAQNIGAGKEKRAKCSLLYGLIITVCWGLVCGIYCQFGSGFLVGLFTKDIKVIEAGAAYLRSYSFDCMFAAIHFCFSGYFCGIQKSGISFIHNIISIVFVRVPGAYFASIYYPNSLFPMGIAAPLGSVLSALICIGYYLFSEVFRRDTVRAFK